MRGWPIWRRLSARAAVSAARRLDAAGAWLTRGEAVRALFREAGYLDVATCRDYGDNERLTLGRLPDMENVG